jgi:single-strand DNA-binding protein
VGVTGQVRTSSYNDANGQRQYRTEVMVDDFYFLEDRATTEGRPQNPAMGASAGTTANSTTVPDPFAHAPQTVDISDDDLPF